LAGRVRRQEDLAQHLLPVADVDGSLLDLQPELQRVALREWTGLLLPGLDASAVLDPSVLLDGQVSLARGSRAPVAAAPRLLFYFDFDFGLFFIKLKYQKDFMFLYFVFLWFLFASSLPLNKTKTTKRFFFLVFFLLVLSWFLFPSFCFFIY
jgi:hypothetical protein